MVSESLRIFPSKDLSSFNRVERILMEDTKTADRFLVGNNLNTDFYQPVFTCSKSTKETLEQCAKFVQS